MLHKLCKSYIQSDDGFAVDMFELSWSEEMVILYMEVEGQRALELRLKKNAPPRIADDAINHWKPPHQNEDLDLNRRMQIAERIKSAMALLQTDG